jgi:hypothetical protein
MEPARHDSLADQLLELHALEEARLVAEAQARAEAELEAKRREEAEAELRREQEEEARRREEEQALAEEQAKREAEERGALEGLEADLRRRLEQEAQAHEAELRHELERESKARVEEGLREAGKRTRLAMAGAALAVLVSVGVYGLVLGPRMEDQTLEIAGMRQKALVLERENEGLDQKIEELEHDVESAKLERPEVAPPLPTQKRPRKKPELKRGPKRHGLEKPACDDNDPLCGI